MRPRPWLFTLALSVLLLLASPAAAATSHRGALFGARYWSQFVEYWEGVLQRQNGVVLLVLGMGVVALLIITRSGKWQK
jgi:hypothetical protein